MCECGLSCGCDCSCTGVSFLPSLSSQKRQTEDQTDGLMTRAQSIMSIASMASTISIGGMRRKKFKGQLTQLRHLHALTSNAVGG